MKKLDNSTLISVIVPVFNVEKYLDRCIESICAQTYRNLEIILVDDGSTDSSGKKCDSWALKDSRIKVLHVENGGQGRARNIGLDVARGELIGFVDSDDYIDGDMYSFLYDLMVGYDADISVCGFYFEENGKNRSRTRLNVPHTYGRDESLALIVKDRLLMNYMWDKLYRRELFDGLRFEEGVIFEDIKFMYKILYRIDRIVIFDRLKYHYVQRKGSTINPKYKPSVNQAYFAAVFEQLGYLIAHGQADAVRPMLRRCLHATKRLILTDGTDGQVRENLRCLQPYIASGYLRAGLSNSYKYWMLDKHLQLYKRLYRLSKGRLRGM